MSIATTRVGRLAIAIAMLQMGACANLSGLDGDSKYACKAPEGVKCDSVSGTYHNAVQGNLPSQRRPSTGGQSEMPAAPNPAGHRTPTLLNTAARPGPSDEAATFLAAPLRASPKILRLWVKAWEDAERDLNGESLVYVQIDSGRWLVDHVQRQTREAFAPVRPGKQPTAAKGAASESTKQAAGIATGEDAPAAISQALRALQGRTPARTDD